MKHQTTEGGGVDEIRHHHRCIFMNWTLITYSTFINRYSWEGQKSQPIICEVLLKISYSDSWLHISCWKHCFIRVLHVLSIQQLPQNVDFTSQASKKKTEWNELLVRKSKVSSIPSNLVLFTIKSLLPDQVVKPLICFRLELILSDIRLRELEWFVLLPSCS